MEALATIIVSVVGTIGTIVSARYAWLAKQAAQAAHGRASIAAEQTANSHGTNLRDDLDGIADDVRAVAAAIHRIEDVHEATTRLVHSQGHQIGEVRRDLTGAVDRHEDDVRRLYHEVDRLRRPGHSGP